MRLPRPQVEGKVLGDAAHSSFADKRLGAAMVVEDDEHMRALLVALLRQHGFETLIAVERINQALEYLECKSIALAVIDLCLGDEDGTALISAMRSHRRAEIQLIPIVAISATSTLPRVEQAIAVGADAFIAKPFSVGSVQRSVTSACVKRHLTTAPKQDVLDAIRLFDRRDSVLEID